MEKIKKTILQITTTGTTTGCTGTCRIIIPDLTVVYHLKVSLTQEAHEWGFFDVMFPDDVEFNEIIGIIDR